LGRQGRRRAGRRVRSAGQEAIVGIIEPNIRRAEIERAQRKRPENLDAYDLYLRALPHLASVMPEDAAIGIDYLEKALKLDPNYAAAHANLAWALEMRFMRGGLNETDAAAGLLHARAAIAHGQDDPIALAIAAIGLLHLGHDFDAAAGAIARALALNSSCATALYFGAHIHAYHGDAALAEEYAARALRLSPFDVLAFEGHYASAAVHIRNQRFAEAASSMAKAVQLNPRFSWLYAAHAAALALAGRVEDSKSVAKRFLELEPNFHIGPYEPMADGMSLPELSRPFLAGMRLAGLPE
jgi:adenylate cyclase